MRPPDEYSVVEYGENETALSQKEFKKMVNYATTLKSEMKEPDEHIHAKLRERGVSSEDAQKILARARENARATRKLRGRQSLILGGVLMIVGAGSVFTRMPGYTIGFIAGGIAFVVMGISFYSKNNLR